MGVRLGRMEGSSMVVKVRENDDGGGKKREEEEEQGPRG